MKHVKYLYVFALAFVLFFAGSCKKSTQAIETDNLTTAITKLNINKETKWLVVLPGLGCHGCIQEGEAFMKKYVKNTNILFVLTNIYSVKILQQKIGIPIKNCPNVYIDRENIFDVHTDNSIYPCIARIENGKIVEHEFQSPKNGAAFYNLRSLLLTQK